MPNSQKPHIHILGAGRVGTLLQKAFARTGYAVETVPRDGKLQISGGVLVICVQDDKLETLVRRLHDDASFGQGVIVCHTAGAYSADMLAPLREHGCHVMAWHPLQTFIGGEAAEVLHGVTFGVDGDKEALAVGRQMAVELGGVPRQIDPEQRMRYHLAAVMSCANLAGLAEMAVDLSGLSHDEGLAALAPLMQQTLRNLQSEGMPTAISGPIRRGDVATLKAHLAILEAHPQAEAVYRATSLKLLDSLRGELDESTYDELRQLLVVAG